MKDQICSSFGKKEKEVEEEKKKWKKAQKFKFTRPPKFGFPSHSRFFFFVFFCFCFCFCFFLFSFLFLSLLYFFSPLVFSLLFRTFFKSQKKPPLFSSLSVCHTKKKMEEEYPNKETEELFEGVENGDEEVVKALLLGNKNKMETPLFI